MSRIIRSKSFWIIAVVMTAASAGAAYATIPDNDGVIHACYARSGGTLHVIDASVTNCKSGETALNWSQSGQPGPQGQQGEPGPAGPTGPQGDPGAPGGLSGYETVSVSTEQSSEDIKDAQAICPAGKVAVGGGASLTGDYHQTVALHTSTPFPQISPNAWIAQAAEIVVTGREWRLTAYAICANPA